jgi:nucleotide-binding universal stress UspA family protein
MLAIKQILFPVDFSPRCKAAVPFVMDLAQQFHAEIVMLSVMPAVWQTALVAPTAGMLDPVVSVPINMDELRVNMKTRLDEYLQNEFAGVGVRRVAKIGEPAMEITQFAREEKVDLIMMATHGWGTFRSLLLGSVASKVLHDAECPVWTTAHVEDAQAHRKAKTILCAVDGGPNPKETLKLEGHSKAADLMQWSQEFADSCAAELRLIHAVTGVNSWPEAPQNQEFEQSLREQSQQAIEQEMQSAGITAPVCVAVGSIESVIREEAERHEADLVIIGRGVLDATLGRLRTHSFDIIRQTPCPVISV